MAKKKIDDFLIEIKEMFIEREVNYLDKLLCGEEPDKDEEKFIKQLKGRIHFVEKMYNKMTGKTGNQKSKAEDELWAKIIDMKGSMGNIVKSAEKTGS